MGIMTNSSSLVFDYPREVVYEYASNPNNWSANYSGSGGIQDEEALKAKIPLQFGDRWTEKINLPSGAYLVSWTLITVNRPSKWVFQMVNGIAKPADGSGEGVDGICTISYTFEEAGEGRCLFTRTLSCELERGVEVPGDLMSAMSTPSGMDKYLENSRKNIDKQHGKQ